MALSQVAIVGAGITGLLAARHVAAAGGHPVVFEATSHSGGRARTKVRGGYYLNQGPHALYVAGAFHAALQKFGVTFSGRGPDLSKGLALWEGAVFPFPVGGINRDAGPLDAGDVSALGAFLDHVSKGQAGGKGKAVLNSIAALPPRAGCVVAALVRLTSYVNSPVELDAGAAFEQLRLSFAGTIYVSGGWQTLVDGLLHAATAVGVDVRTNARVRHVSSEEHWCSVELKEGQTETFGSVVIAVPPVTASSIVAQSTQLASAAANTRPIRLVSLDLALRDLPRPAAAFALGMDTPVYLSAHSASAMLAPTDGALLHVSRYLASGEPVSPAHFEQLGLFADLIQPGWREALIHQQRLSGAVVAHDFPRWSNEGRRAGHSLTDAPGIFLAGDWVGSCGMLADAAAASAQVAATAALEHAAKNAAVGSTSPRRSSLSEARRDNS